MIHDSAPHVQFRAHAILCQSRIVIEDYGNGGITVFFLFYLILRFWVLLAKTFIGSKGFWFKPKPNKKVFFMHRWFYVPSLKENCQRLWKQWNHHVFCSISFWGFGFCSHKNSYWVNGCFGLNLSPIKKLFSMHTWFHVQPPSLKGNPTNCVGCDCSTNHTRHGTC